MKNATQTAGQTANVGQLLMDFVNQRPGLDFHNYGDIKSYRQEMREIVNDRQDFYELLALTSYRLGESFNEKLREILERNSGRLTLEGGKLQYITGQYFPTEYRPAASRLLVSLLWNDYRDEKKADGSPVYADGNAIRKAIRRNLSRRVSRIYFS